MKGYSSREIVKLLTAAGWVKVRQRGSHGQFKHPTRSGLVTVVMNKTNIKTGTVRAILKQAGIVPPK